jgi:hypothetical protein
VGATNEFQTKEVTLATAFSHGARGPEIAHHLDDWGPKGGHEWLYWHHQMLGIRERAFLKNDPTECFPNHTGLWLCMATILKDIPQHRRQAHTAAEIR